MSTSAAYIILLGAPGAGKGTQAQTLAKEMGLAHIATGDLFREAQEKGTELGRLARSYMEKGLLVPDEVTVKMLLERLSQPDAVSGAVLDGFPRTLEQARAFEAALQGRGQQVGRVVYMKVDSAELVRRLSGRWLCRRCQTPYNVVSSPPRVSGRCDRCGGELYQRADDTEETARKRLEVYAQQTAPLVEHYRKQSRLVEVDGGGSIEAVGHALLAAVAPRG